MMLVSQKPFCPTATRSVSACADAASSASTAANQTFIPSAMLPPFLVAQAAAGFLTQVAPTTSTGTPDADQRRVFEPSPKTPGLAMAGGSRTRLRLARSQDGTD